MNDSLKLGDLFGECAISILDKNDLVEPFMIGDGAMCRIVMQYISLKHLRLFMWIFQLNNSIKYMGKNPFLFEELIKIAANHSDEIDPDDIAKILGYAIEVRVPLCMLESLDKLWEATTTKLNQNKLVRNLYSDLSNGYRDGKSTIISRFVKAVEIGITRHINSLYSETCLTLLQSDMYIDVMIQRYHLRTNCLSNRMNNTVRSVSSVELSKWYNEKDFLSSTIADTSSCRFLSDEANTTVSDADLVQHLSKVMQYMDKYTNKRENDKVRTAIVLIFSEIKKVNGRLKFTPILVGSVEEDTQTFHADEFDFVLVCEVDFLKEQFADAIEQLESASHQNLVMRTIHFDYKHRKYPRLSVNWVCEEYLDMRINIDSVPARISPKKIPLPQHKYLTHPHATPTSSPPYTAYQEITVYDDIVYSPIENDLLRNLPNHIQEGYRFAKAIRLVVVLQNIVPQLIKLGVTFDIHDLITSYMLKTCVFYLSIDYTFEEGLVSNNILYWTIAIYKKLKEYVSIGDYKEFFDDKKYVFKGSHHNEIECSHDQRRFDIKLPRYFCCRKRKARFIIINELLRILQLYHEHSNPGSRTCVLL